MFVSSLPMPIPPASCRRRFLLHQNRSFLPCSRELPVLPSPPLLLRRRQSPRGRGTRCLRLFSTDTDVNQTQTDSTTTTASTNTTSLEACREQLLSSAAKYHVHAHGWTTRAIVQAAAALPTMQYSSLSLSVAGLLSQHPAQDLIHYLMKTWNEQLRRDLAHYHDSTSSFSNPAAIVRERVVFAFSTRLGYLKDHVASKTWPAAMALGVANPVHALETRRHLQEMMDMVVDFVTKNKHHDDDDPQQQQQQQSPTPAVVLSETSKAALGAIYMATELHLLTDSYPFTDTWTFLAQRVQEWERLFLHDATGGGTILGASMISCSSPYSSSSSSSTQQQLHSMSPADALSVAWAVSSAFASGIQSLLMTAPAHPHEGSFAATSSAATSTSVATAAAAELLRNFQPPARPPTLPILGEPPEPFVDLWASIFGNNDDKNGSSNGTTSSTANGTTTNRNRRRGTDPSHYDAPSS